LPTHHSGSHADCPGTRRPARARRGPGVPHLPGPHYGERHETSTGTGHFKLALVNDTVSVAYWSNDGTSAAGGEPTTSNDMAETDGRFNVELGGAVSSTDLADASVGADQLVKRYQSGRACTRSARKAVSCHLIAIVIEKVRQRSYGLISK